MSGVQNDLSPGLSPETAYLIPATFFIKIPRVPDYSRLGDLTQLLNMITPEINARVEINKIRL